MSKKLCSSCEKPLKGISIAVTAVDLESDEHRGIATFSKSLLEILNCLGAEVILITGYSTYRLPPTALARISRSASLSILQADVLGQLAGKRQLFKTSRNRLATGLRLLCLFFSLLRGRGIVRGTYFVLRKFTESPYAGVPRIDYLNYVSGVLSVPGIFFLSNLGIRLPFVWTPRVELGPKKIDLLLTTSPLSIAAMSANGHKIPVLQVVHDAFTLHYDQHPDNPFYFYRRLHAASQDNCLFVSNNSREDVLFLLGRTADMHEYPLIIQPPSLSLSDLENAAKMSSIRDVKSPFLLFNSSLVPRKNVSLILRAYIASGLADISIGLVVAGKLHRSSYVQGLLKEAADFPSIQFLDYVTEAEKAWLFLNATALLSPSLTEGFGIPVLDAASMGLRVVASDIPSHREIANLDGLPSKPQLLPVSDISAWINAMKNSEGFALASKHRLEQIEYRLSCYQETRIDFSRKFGQKLSKVILSLA